MASRGRGEHSVLKFVFLLAVFTYVSADCGLKVSFLSYIDILAVLWNKFSIIVMDTTEGRWNDATLR